MTGGPAVPDTISRRLNAERIVVVGWPRAILLQLAHPLVAAGVADHSTFRRGPFTAVMRLHYTIRAMLALTFGDEQQRTASLEGIRAIHRRVNGSLRETTGIFPAGTRYSAEDPDLVLWVHGTLLETIPLVYELLVGPITPDERDAYCDEAAAIAIDLGARPADVPRTWRDTTAYLTRMYASGAIAVGRDATDLTASVLSPLGVAAAPLGWMNRLLTVGLLPDNVRRMYGYAWSERHERRFRRLAAVMRAGRRIAPAPVALWPEARHVSSRV